MALTNQQTHKLQKVTNQQTDKLQKVTTMQLSKDQILSELSGKSEEQLNRLLRLAKESHDREVQQATEVNLELTKEAYQNLPKKGSANTCKLKSGSWIYWYKGEWINEDGARVVDQSTIEFLRKTRIENGLCIVTGEKITLYPKSHQDQARVTSRVYPPQSAYQELINSTPEISRNAKRSDRVQQLIDRRKATETTSSTPQVDFIDSSMINQSEIESAFRELTSDPEVPKNKHLVSESESSEVVNIDTSSGTSENDPKAQVSESTSEALTEAINLPTELTLNKFIDYLKALETGLSHTKAMASIGYKGGRKFSLVSKAIKSLLKAGYSLQQLPPVTMFD